MSIRLFGSRLSPFVEKVVRALTVKGLPFALVPPRLPTDFRTWNPQTGKMPVLEIDGERAWDSSAILRRLDALWPLPPLFANDTATAAKQRFLEDWSDEALYWYGMAFRWTPANAGATAAQVLGDIGVPAILHPLLAPIVGRRIGGQAVGQGLVRLPVPLLEEELGRRLDELLVWLDDRPFFFADRLSGADLAIFGQLRMLESGSTPEAARLVASRPALVAWAARVDAATRPAIGPQN